MHIRIAEMDALVEENRRRMRACDSLARRNKLQQQRRRIATKPTLADLAMSNPYIAKLYREAQDAGAFNYD
jgi:hypothetical protein